MMKELVNFFLSSSFFKKSCFLFFLGVLCVSCKNFRERNCYEDKMFIDNGKPNVNNLDNTIYKSGSKFIYSIHFFKDNIEYILELKGLRREPVLVQKKDIDDDATRINKFILTVFKGTYKSILQDQTIIKYDYYYDDCPIGALSELSGIIEDERMIFLHPPRTSSGFSFFEVTPFPVVNFPLALNKEWTSNLHVQDNMRQDLKISESQIHNKYQIVGKEQIKLKTMGVMDCFVIHCKSLANGKIVSSCKYYFNEKFGFVKLDIDYRGRKIMVELKEVK
ncbi:hypothetical protein [Flavobacterium sp. WV_118_3]|uniref:hypothetical protein n=1 Tax=Flavobacterium sp. WV_118_3 TaxID=3151764 RepID=UPI00321C2359